MSSDVNRNKGVAETGPAGGLYLFNFNVYSYHVFSSCSFIFLVIVLWQWIMTFSPSLMFDWTRGQLFSWPIPKTRITSWSPMNLWEECVVHPMSGNSYRGKQIPPFPVLVLLYIYAIKVMRACISVHHCFEIHSRLHDIGATETARSETRFARRTTPK